MHSADLLAEALKALIERSGIDPAEVEQVVGGCVSQVGEQSGLVGRNLPAGASKAQVLADLMTMREKRGTLGGTCLPSAYARRRRSRRWWCSARCSCGCRRRRARRSRSRRPVWCRDAAAR